LTLILHGPIEVIIGVVFGVFWGILAQWIPNKDHHHVAFFRWLILLGGGLIALFGAHLIHYDGAGGLATIIMAFVAGMEWRREGWDDHNPVTKTFHRMWLILEPVIFALIGTEIQIHKINPKTLGLSIAVLIIALFIRMVGTYGAVSGGNLSKKEKIFMAFAWMPKATVQAALGPIFLDNVAKLPIQFWNTTEGKEAWQLENPTKDITEWTPLGDKDQWLGWGEDILTLAVIRSDITANVKISSPHPNH
jgi:NhaP-type Na+/H+ or K+/H+ antiporter